MSDTLPFDNSTCGGCPLFAHCASPFLPTQAHARKGRDIALLVVGNQPGYEEDRDGAHFTGQSGHILRGVYLGWLKPERWADVYLTNAVRCFPPGGTNPTIGQIKLCASHLERDVKLLTTRYKRVVILAAGAAACRAIWRTTEKAALREQARVWHGAVVFVTHNPAMLLPGREPAKAHAVNDHLRLVRDYLEHGRLTTLLDKPTPELGRVPETPPSVLAFDIETYGAIAGYNQTGFNPCKSCHLDGVSLDELVQTAAVAWRDPAGELQCAAYVWPEHRVQFSYAMRQCIDAGGRLVGQNVLFDVMNLRAVGCDWLSRANFATHGAILEDLMISNFQQSNVRSEKGLKPTAMLFGVSLFEDAPDFAGGFRYPSNRDPELLSYNALDCLSTLVLRERFRAMIAEDYPGSDKLSVPTLRFHNALLWTVCHMTEHGVRFDRDALAAIGAQCETRMTRILAGVDRRYGGRIAGTGCKAFLKRAVETAAEDAGLIGDSRLERTKTMPVSTCRDNLNLVFSNLPREAATRPLLRAILRHRKLEKLFGSYVRAMLVGGRSKRKAAGPNRAVALVGEYAHPSWYVVPSYPKDDEGDEGGTQQARLAAKGPAIQTIPPPIYGCIRSRFPGGVVLSVDYSNLELRTAALLSGDPVMLGEFERGEDRHTNTAIAIFGPDIVSHPQFQAVYRQAGKQFNFARLFRAGPGKLQQILRIRCAFEWPLRECREAIRTDERRYPVFTAWQAAEIERACRTARVIMPVLGDSRLFAGSRATIRDTYTNIICNMKIQVSAARILQSAHAALVAWLDDSGMRSVTPCQTHDSVLIDCHPDEVAGVRAHLPCAFALPDYAKRLEFAIGNKVPLLFKVSEVWK